VAGLGIGAGSGEGGRTPPVAAASLYTRHHRPQRAAPSSASAAGPSPLAAAARPAAGPAVRGRCRFCVCSGAARSACCSAGVPRAPTCARAAAGASARPGGGPADGRRWRWSRLGIGRARRLSRLGIGRAPGGAEKRGRRGRGGAGAGADRGAAVGVFEAEIDHLQATSVWDKVRDKVRDKVLDNVRETRPERGRRGCGQWRASRRPSRRRWRT